MTGERQAARDKTRKPYGLPLSGQLETVDAKDIDKFFKPKEPSFKEALLALKVGDVRRYKIPPERNGQSTKSSLTRMARNAGMDLEFAPSAPEGYVVFRVIPAADGPTGKPPDDDG